MNKKSYKLIFSKRHNKIIAVGENASSISHSGARNHSKRGVVSHISYVARLSVCSFAALIALDGYGSAFAAPAVNALPAGASVAAGKVAISQSGNTLTVNQTTNQAIVNWNSFNIGANAKVNIVQPNASSVQLDRVTGNNPSQIFGQLTSNGQVILVNPNGIVFGKDGSVSASSFTASTLGISDANFLAGNYRYTRDGATGIIENNGSLQSSSGGYVALLGAQVTNNGKIIAPQGTAYLGAAEAITVPLSSSGKIKLELSPAAINTAVTNSSTGTIVAEGGQVFMQAAALNDVAATAVSTVTNSGAIDVSGAQAGNVAILTDYGNIKVDGSISANSTNPSNKGGNIIIGRDADTGVLSATSDVSGATLQAKGGFIETSGQYLKTDGVKITAKNWLLDPNNVEINSTSTANTAGDSVVLSSDIVNALSGGANVVISTGAVGVTNASATNLISPATITGTGTQGAGTIAVNSAIAGASNAVIGGSSASSTLTLSAASNITVGAIINTAGNLYLQSNGGAITNSAAISGKNISIDNTGGTINATTGAITAGGSNAGSAAGITTTATITASGNLNLYGVSSSSNGINIGGNLSGANIQATGKTTSAATGFALTSGNITTTGTSGSSVLTGISAANNGGGFSAFDVKNSSSITAASGTTLALVGNATGSSTDNYANTRGFRLDSGTTLTTSGAVSITGTSKSDDGVLFLGSIIQNGVGSSLNISGTNTSTGGGGQSGVTTAGITLNNASTLTIAGLANNTSATMTGSEFGTFINGTITGSGGAISITGGSSSYSNSTGLKITSAITSGNGAVNLFGQNLYGSGGAAVMLGASVNSGTANLVVQSANNLISQTAGTLTGKNVTIDNTGAGATSLIVDATATPNLAVGTALSGSISSATGAITAGSGVSYQSNGVSLAGSGISASGNVNIQGNVASTANNGVNIGSTVAITSSATSAIVNIGSNGGIVNAAAIKVTGSTGTGANINLISAGNGGITGAGAIGDTTNKNASVTFTQTGTSTYDGAINGANFTKAGTGTLSLDSWSLTTPVLTNISNAYTVQDGGTLNLLPSSNYQNISPANVNIVNNSTFGEGISGNAYWINTAFNFTGGLGGGTLNLGGNPIGSGSTTTNTISTSGGATNTITGGFNANNANVNLNIATATSGTQLLDGSYAAINFASASQGGAGLYNVTTVTKTGSGNLLFNDKFTGTNLALNAGNIQIGSGAAATGSTTPTEGITNVAIASGSSITFDRAEAYTNSSSFTGAGSLVQAGAGVLTLTGISSAFAGSTTVNDGKTLAIGTGGSLGAAGSTLSLVSSTSSLQFTNTSGNSVVGSTISGPGAVTENGTGGTGVLAANNTYTGTATISSGTLQVGNGGATGSLGSNTGAITDNGTLAYNLSSNVAVANQITGTGSLSQMGSGITTLTGTNTYSGTTSIASGSTLQLGAGSTTGSIANTSSIVDNGSLIVNHSDAVSLTQNITGTGALTQSGAGTTTVTGTNTYTGSTTVSGGTLQVGASSTSGTTGTLGTGAVTLSNGSTLSYQRDANTTINNVITGTGNVIANITGTLGIGSGGISLAGSGSFTPSISLTSTGAITQTGALSISNASSTNTSISLTTTAAGSGITLATINGSNSGTGVVNVAVESNGGTVAANGAISANNISLDNTNGTIDTTSGVITRGSAGLTSGTLGVGASNLNAASNINIAGNGGSIAYQGVSLSHSTNGIRAGNAINVYGSTGYSHGVDINNAAITAGGPITITGNQTNNSDVGVIVWFGSSITANGGSNASGDAINITGSGSRAIVINNASIINNSIGGNTSISGTGGLSQTGGIANTELDNGAVITNANTAGAVLVSASGYDTSHVGTTVGASNSTTGGALPVITQNSIAGVVISSQYGSVAPPKIINNGNGNVVIAAGTGFTAGNGLSANIIAPTSLVSPALNPVINNGTGKVYLYSGSTTDTGNLSALNAGFNNLYLAGSGIAPNAQLSTAYSVGVTVAGSTSNTQVMFRDTTAPTYNLTLANLSKVYGTNDPTLTTSALQLAYTAAGGSTNITGTLGNNSYAMLASQAISGLDLSGASRSLTGTLAGEQMGTYAYTGIAGTSTSLNISQPSLVITPKTLTVTANSINSTYDGTSSYNSLAGYSTSDLVSSVDGVTTGDAVNSVVSAFSNSGGSILSSGIAQAGSLTQTVSLATGTGLSNYNINYVSATGNIAKATLTFTGNSTNSVVYNGNTQTNTYSVSTNSGIVNSTNALGTDVLNVSGMATGRNVVTGGVTDNLSVTGSAATLANYTILTTNGKLLITPATLIINAVSDSKTYNGSTASSGVATYSTSAGNGLLLGTTDTLTGVTQTFGSKNVLGTNSSTLGIANYTVNDGNNGNNYNVVTNTALGTITPASLIIKAAADTKVYDGSSASSMPVIFNGLQGSDTASATQVFNSPNVLSANTTLVSAYTVNDGNSGNNYHVSLQTGSGSITPAPVVISGITAANKVYDGTTLATLNTSNIVYSGLQAGDVIATSATGAFNNPSVGINKPVALSLVNTGSSLPNYVITNQAYAYANITANSAPAPLPPNVNPVSPAVVPSSIQSAGLGVSFGPASLEESDICSTKQSCNCDATGTAGVEICYSIDVDSIKSKIQISKLGGGKW